MPLVDSEKQAFLLENTAILNFYFFFKNIILRTHSVCREHWFDNGTSLFHNKEVSLF